MSVEKSLIYTLGMVVGDCIVDTALPTLSTDMIRSRTVIEVNEELTKEWDVRHDNWWNNREVDKENDNKIFYENLAWYKKNIEEKYLKDELVIHNATVTEYVDKELFLKGINDSLWHCDLSHYTAVDIEHTSFHDFGIFIKLKKDA